MYKAMRCMIFIHWHTQSVTPLGPPIKEAVTN